MAEHDAAGEALAKMRELSHGYTPPEGACPRIAFFQALLEFEQDMHRHVHLENYILFPRAIDLDESSGWRIGRRPGSNGSGTCVHYAAAIRRGMSDHCWCWPP